MRDAAIEAADVSAGDLWRQLARQLAGAGIGTPLLDAEVLLRHVMGWQREDFLRAPETGVDSAHRRRLAELAEARCAGAPVARLLGCKEFWSLQFNLCAESLIPRPQSETLVAAALQGFDADAPLRILDLGCGSGCLLLALLWERRRASGVGIDISASAVATAAGNAKALGLDKRARFQQGNWGAGVTERFDLLVSNPPYIASGDIAGLQREVRLHDPHIALDGGADGMVALRIIIDAGMKLLRSPARGEVSPRSPLMARTGVRRSGKRLLLEVGAGQAASIAAHMEQRGWRQVRVHRDIAGVQRVVAAVSTEN